jgi:DNA-binding protein HU-beta
MNKYELIGKIAIDTGMTRVAATAAVDSLIEGVTASLKRGQRVTLVGFGTFAPSKRRARTGRNPQTGETIEIEAKNGVRFKVGTELDARLNGR